MGLGAIILAGILATLLITAQPAGSHIMKAEGEQRPLSEARLMISRHRVGGGEHVSFWIKNRGTHPLFYGEPFVVERREGADWVSTTDANLKPWRRWLKKVRSGQRGKPQVYLIPDDALAGCYRVRKIALVAHTGNSRRPVSLRARFIVH